MEHLPAEAWVFFGVVVTALSGIATIMVQQRRKGKVETTEDKPAEGAGAGLAPIAVLPTPHPPSSHDGDALEQAVGKALDSVLAMLGKANERLDQVQIELTNTKDQLKEARAETKTLTRQNLNYQLTISELQGQLNTVRTTLAAAEAEIRVLRERGGAA